MATAIRKGVPPPPPLPKTGRAVSEAYATLADLEVEDSYFIPGKKIETVRTHLQSKQVRLLKEDGGRRFTAEAGVDENGVAGVWVWRIANKATT